METRSTAARYRLALTLLAGMGLAGSAAADIIYNGFNDASGLNLRGSAKTEIDPLGGENNILRLTDTTPSVVGAAWHRNKVALGGAWESEITFRMSERGGPAGYNPLAGADGFAFVIQNTSPTLFASNSSTLGGGIGYNGLGRVVAVEIDTWMNERAEDVSANHISVHVPGAGNTTSHERDSIGSMTTGLPELSDGELHTLFLSYEPGSLSIRVDGQEAPALTVAIDLDQTLGLEGGLAWMGLTSATGGCWENHDIYSWGFRVVPAPAGASILTLAGVMWAGRRRRG